MIEIKPFGFYQREELVSLFAAAGVDWDSLAKRMKVPRRSRMLFFGGDILAAWNGLPDMREGEEESMGEGIQRGRGRKSGQTMSLAALVERKRVHGN